MAAGMIGPSNLRHSTPASGRRRTKGPPRVRGGPSSPTTALCTMGGGGHIDIRW
jgi:hypothetical protein